LCKLAIPLNEGSGLSIRNEIMPYRQSFRPVLGYAYPIWICAVRTHACKMELVQQGDLELAASHFAMPIPTKFTSYSVNVTESEQEQNLIIHSTKLLLC
jgi:hypothetical protein